MNLYKNKLIKQLAFVVFLINAFRSISIKPAFFKPSMMLFFIYSGVFAVQAQAAGSVAAGDINYLLFYKGHTGLLIKHEFPSDPDNCGRQDYYILPDGHAHFEQIYSLLLAAQMANKKVSFNINGCHQGIPAIVHVGLSKQ